MNMINIVIRKKLRETYMDEIDKYDFSELINYYSHPSKYHYYFFITDYGSSAIHKNKMNIVKAFLKSKYSTVEIWKSLLKSSIRSENAEINTMIMEHFEEYYNKVKIEVNKLLFPGNFYEAGISSHILSFL